MQAVARALGWGSAVWNQGIPVLGGSGLSPLRAQWCLQEGQTAP